MNSKLTLALLLMLGGRSLLNANSELPEEAMRSAVAADQRFLGGRYSEVAALPDLKFVSDGVMTKLTGFHAKGAFITKPGFEKSVYLLDQLDIDHNDCDRAVLVHEAVHFLQFEKIRLSDPSAAQRILDRGGFERDAWIENEEQAYQVQYAWMQSQNSIDVSALQLGPGQWAFNCRRRE